MYRNACWCVSWNLATESDAKGEFQTLPLPKEQLLTETVCGVGRTAPGKQGSSKEKSRVFSVLVLHFLCLHIIFNMTAQSVRNCLQPSCPGRAARVQTKRAGFCSCAHPSPLHHSGKVNEPPSGRRFVQWNCPSKELPELIPKTTAVSWPKLTPCSESYSTLNVWMGTHKSLGLHLQILTRWGKL